MRSLRVSRLAAFVAAFAGEEIRKNLEDEFKVLKGSV